MTNSELFLSDISRYMIITDGDVEYSEGEYVVSDYTVMITNDTLVAESFSLHEILTSDESINFGECNASEISFSTLNMYTSLLNKVVSVYFVFEDEDHTIYQLGTYKVYSDRPTADRSHRDVVAYDLLYDLINADVMGWYNTLLPTSSSTTTVAYMRHSLLAHFGIDEDILTTPLLNDAMVVKRTINPQTLSGADVITSLCQVNGCFGHIGRDGKFHSVLLKQGIEGLYPALDLYPSEDLLPRESDSVYYSQSTYFPPCEYEDYKVQSITKVEIRKDDNSIGVLVGSGDNGYVISGNFLLYGKTSSQLTPIAQNILDTVKNVIYRPYSVDVKGCPDVEIGNAIRLNTTTQRIESYVFERTLNGIASLRDSFLADGTETRGEKINSISSRFEAVNSVISSEVEALNDSLALKILEDGTVVTRLSADANGLTFEGNKVVINTNNFKLDEDGNAEFSGDVKGATISGSSLISQEVLDPTHIKTTIIDGGGFEQSYGLKKIVIGDGYIQMFSNDVLKCIINDSGGYFNGSEYILTSASQLDGTKVVGRVPSATSATNADNSARANYANYLGDAYNSVWINGYNNFVPSSSGTMRCGGSQGKWSEVWADNGTIQTSDRNLKNNIEDIDERYVDLIVKLMPKRFKMNNGTSNRFHMGFIAQDVEELLAECGIESTEFAGLIKDVYTDEDGNEVEYYALRYSEFIAPLVMAWQRTEDKLNKLINTLQTKGVIDNE